MTDQGRCEHDTTCSHRWRYTVRLLPNTRGVLVCPLHLSRIVDREATKRDSEYAPVQVLPRLAERVDFTGPADLGKAPREEGSDDVVAS